MGMGRLTDLLVFLIVVFAVLVTAIDNPIFAVIAVPIILLLVFLFAMRNAVVRT